MKLVYLSPVAYRGFAQRPHRFVEFFTARSGGCALWIEPYPGRLPRIADIGGARPGTSHHRPRGRVEVCSPWGVDPLMTVPLCRQLVWRRVLERVRGFVAGCRWLLMVGRPSYLALHLLRNTASTASCYDAMDDFPEFYSGWSRWLSRRIEARVARGVDTIAVTSEALRDKFARAGLKTELLRNGFDAGQRWAEAGPQGETVFGYVGTIGSWFDWELVAGMARQLPEVRFDLVGPVLARPPSLPANVRLCGECPGDAVPEKMRGFTAGLIPFKVNRLTAAVDPVKYYEYRSVGLPVISTRFGDMALREDDPRVCLVDGRTDVRGLFSHVGTLKPCSGESLERFRAANSWASRFEKSRFLRDGFPRHLRDESW